MSDRFPGVGGELPRGAERALTRGFGSPVLFVIVWTSLVSAIYFSLGVIAHNALGLTPLVFFLTAIMFGLAAMTYVEGASLHQDRAGASVFARYAFNELVSFVAGWVIILDYVILVAVTSFCAANYAGAFHAPLASGGTEIALGIGLVLYVAVRNVRGFDTRRTLRVSALVGADIALQLVIIAVGLALFFDADLLLDPIALGSAPTWEDTIFALGVGTVVFTGLESASGLAGETGVGREGLRRLVVSSTGAVMVVYVGIALVAMTALPVTGGETALGDEYREAPMLGIADAFEQAWLRETLTYTIATTAILTLVAAANSAMLGLSRLSYNLATNRQIPSAIGRLHRTRSTPFVAITGAAVIAAALVIPQDLEMLVGIYAFGALLGLTIAHVSIVVLRIRDPGADRPYRIPWGVRARGIDVPVPAVLGAALSFGTWVSVLVFHSGARWVGLGWMVAGLIMYVGYRVTQGKPLLRRVIVAESALRRENVEEVEYGSILVPISGSALDDDIMQTAGRLAGTWHDDFADEEGALIEAIFPIEVPMTLPIDGRLPDAQIARAKAALRRAKAVGEEYDGVEVATAIVRTRRTGRAIVEEARRRGVEAIVLAAEEPTRIRGGALLGGRGGPRDNFVGPATKYVLLKAPCQVILTAPGARETASPAVEGEE